MVSFSCAITAPTWCDQLQRQYRCVLLPAFPSATVCNCVEHRRLHQSSYYAISLGEQVGISVLK